MKLQYMAERVYFSNLILSHPLQKRTLELRGSLLESSQFKSQQMADWNTISHVVNNIYPNRLIKFFTQLPSSYIDNANYVEAITVGVSSPDVAFHSLLNSQSHSSFLFAINQYSHSFWTSQNSIGVGYVIQNNNFYWSIHIAQI